MLPVMRFSSKVCFRAILILLAALSCAPASSRAATNHFQFRTPRTAGYHLDASPVQSLAAPLGQTDWVTAWPDDGATNSVQLGNRVVLQLLGGADLKPFLTGRALTLSRTVAPGVFILQAPDAWTAVREADALAQLPGVAASYPIVRQPGGLLDAYAPAPNDQWWVAEYYFEHRNADGSSAGMDLNTRAAWPWTLGAGVTIAIADTGVELTHPEFTNRAAGGPHFNFITGTTNAGPVGRSASFAHGTEVAGLALAEAGNGVGMAGAAPLAQLASWVIFDTNGALASDEQLMDMYQYSSNSVAVQNHSWSHGGLRQFNLTLLEQIGLSNALTAGRNGLGTVMVRAAGNDRAVRGSADDNPYPADPRVIAVAAARVNGPAPDDGRATSYSDPGACVLVGAPGGDANTLIIGLFTTDLLGTDGVDTINYLPPYGDLNNYAFNATGFNGTSGAAPQIAGIAALLLSANPGLTSRDVQQILLLSARHFDLNDPDLRTNGAGLRVSHNLGFGIPDAGEAVRLARGWSNRPPPTVVTLTASNVAAIPDDGLRLWITGTNVPLNLVSIDAAPSLGPHADTPTPLVPLVDAGTAATPLTNNLAGCAALIQRSPNNFSTTISNAAAAGAVFAVVYNSAAGNGACGGGDVLCTMGSTDFVPIPAIFIGETDGENLRTFVQQNTNALAQIRLTGTNYVFNVTNTLVCEQVQVRLQTDHPSRGDLRITLVSPQGTRSILQHVNGDTSPGPVDWTYYSTHHFLNAAPASCVLTSAMNRSARPAAF